MPEQGKLRMHVGVGYEQAFGQEPQKTGDGGPIQIGAASWRIRIEPRAELRSSQTI